MERDKDIQEPEPLGRALSDDLADEGLELREYAKFWGTPAEEDMEDEYLWARDERR